MSIGTGRIDKCVLILGDQEITGKNCIVERVELSSECSLSPISFATKREIDHLIGPTITRMSIDLIFQELTMEELINPNKKKISSKRVSECTIPELLFAVRTKME